MPPFIQFLIRRFLIIPLSLFIITLILYAGVMLAPPEARADIYRPDSGSVQHLTPEQNARITESIIKEYHLRDPYIIQYGYWLKNFFGGLWGYSPTLESYVLPALLRRTPATAELTIFSMLLIIPLGMIAGVNAGWKQKSAYDFGFRSMAFLVTSIPPFILSLAFLSVFYINLGWFAPERIGMNFGFEIENESFYSPTGMLTIDALINGRFDIFLDALRHLAMPALTLSLYHWATLARITRSTIIEHSRKEYVISARARGIPEHDVMWKHAFRNVLVPALTSIGLSAATLVMGVYVVEIIYNIKGVSEIITIAMSDTPDAAAALGFSVYSVIVVLLIMFVLDIFQAIFDPRLREDLIES